MLILLGGWQISLRKGAAGNTGASGTGATSLEEGYKAPQASGGSL
jgi:hypothetical protein